MATKDELNELRERIGRLYGADQAWLLEAVLVDNRRRWEAEIARQQAAVKELLELEKKLGKPLAPAPFTFPPEAKREAG